MGYRAGPVIAGFTQEFDFGHIVGKEGIGQSDVAHDAVKSPPEMQGWGLRCYVFCLDMGKTTITE